MIKLAINLGIAKLSELCIDGTRVLANANKYKTWTAARLARALEELDGQITQALATLETNDAFDEDLIGQDVSTARSRRAAKKGGHRTACAVPLRFD